MSPLYPMEILYAFENDLALCGQPYFRRMWSMWEMQVCTWRGQDLGDFAELGILSEKANESL